MPTSSATDTPRDHPDQQGDSPSRWPRRILACVIAFAGFLMAGYMGLYQWKIIHSVWDPVFGEQSERVLDSWIPEMLQRWFYLPDAIVGAIVYLVEAIVAVWGDTRRWWRRPWVVLAFGFTAVLTALTGVGLVLMQATVVLEWCFLCILSMVCSLIILYLAWPEVMTSCRYLRRIWRETRSYRLLWRTFVGRSRESFHD